MRSVVLVSLIALSVLAGCIAADDSSDSGSDDNSPAVRPELPDDPLPAGDGHDHGAPDEHRFLWNYDLSDHDRMEQDEFRTAGLHALQIADGNLFGAVYGHHAVSANGGLAIWDLAKPEAPEQVGHVRVPGHVGGDRSLGVTPDGDFAVIGAEQVTCFGHVNPLPVNAYLIDTRDKANPVIADILPVTVEGVEEQDPRVRRGTHSVWVHNIGGEDYAFIWGQMHKINRDGPAGAVLESTGVTIPVGHDMYVRDTPDGEVWGLAATGSNFRVYDLSDPMEPELIAIFDEGDGHYLHTADVAFLDDGEIVMILTSEDWEDHLSPMWVFDATELPDHPRGGDPLSLEPVYTWTNPSERTATNMHFSIHNPRFHDNGILSLSHYHGGLLQLDFRHEEFRDHPAEIAYAVYAADNPPMMVDPVQTIVEENLCGLGLGLDTPMYMDVEVGPGGILYAADVFMGLYTFTPTEEHPVYGAVEEAEE